MREIINRSIDDFKGEAVVIGCTHFSGYKYCNKQNHSTEEAFYTIDLDELKKPDFVVDIRSELPSKLKHRFKLALLENVDFTAYNSGDIKNSSKGFDNIWAMTESTGFIVIVGCPRHTEFREEIAKRKLNHIELDAKYGSVLIPKNQFLSFDQVQKRIETLEPALLETIERAKGSLPNPELSFCNAGYDALESFSEHIRNEIKKPRQLTPEETKQAELFKSLYSGQHFFYNKEDNQTNKSISNSLEKTK